MTRFPRLRVYMKKQAPKILWNTLRASLSCAVRSWRNIYNLPEGTSQLHIHEQQDYKLRTHHTTPTRANILPQRNPNRLPPYRSLLSATLRTFPSFTTRIPVQVVHFKLRMGRSIVSRQGELKDYMNLGKGCRSMIWRYGPSWWSLGMVR